MNWTFIILLMIFAHVVADYNLQGWLASAKQKSYWEANAPDKMYKYDYLCALLMHSFAWSFLIMLPIAAFDMNFNADLLFIWILMWNTLTHAFVDHMKANWKWINLWADQGIHMVQIVITAIFFIIHQG